MLKEGVIADGFKNPKKEFSEERVQSQTDINCSGSTASNLGLCGWASVLG